MKRCLMTFVLAGVLAVPALPIAAHEAPNFCGRKQGDGAGWSKNRGHHVECERARRVAQKWEDKCVFNQNCPGKPDKIHSVKPGWECTHKKVGYETVRVKCTANKGPAIVHFLWGS